MKSLKTYRFIFGKVILFSAAISSVAFSNLVKAQESYPISPNIRVVVPLPENNNGFDLYDYLNDSSPKQSDTVNYIPSYEFPSSYKFAFFENSSLKLNEEFIAEDFSRKSNNNFLYNGGYIIWGDLHNLFGDQ